MWASWNLPRERQQLLDPKVAEEQQLQHQKPGTFATSLQQSEASQQPVVSWPPVVQAVGSVHAEWLAQTAATMAQTSGGRQPLAKLTEQHSNKIGCINVAKNRHYYGYLLS